MNSEFLMKKFFTLTLLFLSFISLSAQKEKLTFEQVFEFAPPRLTKQIPTPVKWLDGKNYLLSERKSGTIRYIKTNVQTGEKEVFFDYSEIKDALPAEFQSLSPTVKSKDFLHYIYEKNGDLYYFSVEDNFFKRLTATAGEEKNPTFSPDYKYIAYTLDNNLYVYDLDKNLSIQLTNDGSETIKNGYSSWVYNEEILGRSSHYKAFYWSPDSRKLAYLKFDDSPVPRFPLFNVNGVHGSLEWEYYPYPGDKNPIVRLGILNLETKQTTWIDSTVNEDKYIAWVFWSPSGKNLLYEEVNRGQDHLMFHLVDLNTGKNKIIYKEHQKSWVDFKEDIRFADNEKSIFFVSDFQGRGRVYKYSTKGKPLRSFGKKKTNITKIISFDNSGNIYCEGFPLGSTDNFIYRFDKRGREKLLTKDKGYHHGVVSPDGNFILDTYSNISRPSELLLFNVKKSATKVLFDSKSADFDKFELGKTELFYIPNRNGLKLPAKWILPPDFSKDKKYPVLFSIYGGPGTPIVKNRFARWLKDYYYSQLGIIVINVDNRGAGHYGKKVLAEMHRNLGKYDLDDFIDAAKWIKKQPFVDSTRIGITGGSYGGYITLLALTRGADQFTHGLAEFAVTDWRLYDDIYTERYMDEPRENPKGYEYGSVMTYADKLKGALKITAGTLDDNVHYQNTLQLVDKLENLGKHFELMIYPNERHGYRSIKWFHAVKENLNFWKTKFNLSE